MDLNPLEALNGHINTTVDTIRRNNAMSFAIRAIVIAFQFWISSLAIIWTSVFIYLMLYYNYIPLVSTTRDVFIQYHSTCDRTLRDSVCNVPTARVALRQGRTSDFLRGQIYRFSIDLQLPESDVNWSQGLFMVRLKLLDQKQRVIANVAKPTGLRYKSTPLRFIVTLLYWPLFVMGLAEENQQITVNLMDDYTEGSYPKVGPIHEAVIEFEARDVQIYPPTVLKVSATLTGFRYYMYNYRITTGFVGITTIASFLYLITFFAFANYLRINYNNNPNHNHNHNANNNDNYHRIRANTQITRRISSPEITAQKIESNGEIVENKDEEKESESGLTGEVSTLESETDSKNTSFNSDSEETEQLPDSSIGDS